MMSHTPVPSWRSDLLPSSLKSVTMKNNKKMLKKSVTVKNREAKARSGVTDGREINSKFLQPCLFWLVLVPSTWKYFAHLRIVSFSRAFLEKQ